MPRESLDAQVNALRWQCNRCGIAFGCRNHDTLCCIKGTINACLDGYTFQEEREDESDRKSDKKLTLQFLPTAEIFTEGTTLSVPVCLNVICQASDLE